MIGVTIGVGKYKRIAIEAARRMECFTGLKTHVICDYTAGIKEFPVSHPSWLKCFVIDLFPNEDSFLVFDSDIACIRPWNPHRLFEELGRAFCAVPDQRSQNVFDECNNFGIPFPDIYINGGLLMFGKEHKPIWKETFSRHPIYGTWLEQTSLNLALLETEMPVCRLPRRFNWISQKAKYDLEYVDADGALNVHFCGLATADEVEKAQRKYGLYALQEPPKVSH